MLQNRSIVTLSGRPEIGEALTKALQGASIDVTHCSTLAETQEILIKKEVELLFCDEDFPGGSFRDVLKQESERHHPPNIAVVLEGGEWPEYLEALLLGAFGVCPRPRNMNELELCITRILQRTGAKQQPEVPLTG
jgi:DNA-binding NtrC family response regulator